MARHVYRVEHQEKGCGPYYYDVSWASYRSRMMELADIDVRQPQPWRDGLTDFDRNRHNFGFVSVEQFTRWFTVEERELLEAHGFVLHAFEVEEVHEGGCQCVFCRAEARRLATFSCLNLTPIATVTQEGR